VLIHGIKKSPGHHLRLSNGTSHYHPSRSDQFLLRIPVVEDVSTENGSGKIERGDNKKMDENGSRRVRGDNEQG
jgi:hypothetical protein